MTEVERMLKAYGRAADEQVAPVTVTDIETAAASRPLGPADESPDDVVGEEEPATDLRRRSRTSWLLVAAIVALLTATVGMFAVLTEDSEGGVDVVHEPDGDPSGDVAPASTTSTTTTTTPVDPWEFDVTYVEGVDAGNAVAVGDGLAWVAGTAEPILSTIDLATNEVVATAEIPPLAGHANFGFGSVWINHDDGTVTRFDPDTATVVARIEVGGQPAWIEPGDDSMWLGNGPGRQAVRIDPATNEVVATVELRSGWRPGGGLSVGPTSVWIGGDSVITRFDF